MKRHDSVTHCRFPLRKNEMPSRSHPTQDVSTQNRSILLRAMRSKSLVLWSRAAWIVDPVQVVDRVELRTCGRGREEGRRPAAEEDPTEEAQREDGPPRAIPVPPCSPLRPCRGPSRLPWRGHQPACAGCLVLSTQLSRPSVVRQLWVREGAVARHLVRRSVRKWTLRPRRRCEFREWRRNRSRPALWLVPNSLMDRCLYGPGSRGRAKTGIPGDVGLGKHGVQDVVVSPESRLREQSGWGWLSG
jgi:hypothetical protein